MRMISFFLAALAAVHVAAADSSTVISYLSVTNTVVDLSAYTSTAARVIGIDKHATTYEVGCVSGAKKCAYPQSITMAQGPNTYAEWGDISVSSDGVAVVEKFTQTCTFTHSSESVVCSLSIAYTVAEDGTSASANTAVPSYTIASGDITYGALTVTDGLYAFTAAATASATAVSITATGGAAVAKPIVTAVPIGAAIAMAAML